MIVEKGENEKAGNMWEEKQEICVRKKGKQQKRGENDREFMRDTDRE